MLLYSLVILVIIHGLSLIWVKNPVQSIFILILIFLQASGMLLLLKVEFLALLLVIVYVGAIAVLFLFVIMMLNIKLIDLSEKLYKYVPLGMLISCVIIIILGMLIEMNINYNSRISNLYMNWERELYVVEPMMYIGVVICTYLNSYFVVISLILLLALIGAIVLALDSYWQKLVLVKRQFIIDQVKAKKTNVKVAWLLYI